MALFNKLFMEFIWVVHVINNTPIKICQMMVNVISTKKCQGKGREIIWGQGGEGLFERLTF